MARKLEDNELLVIEKLSDRKMGLRIFIEAYEGEGDDYHLVQTEHIGTIREGLGDMSTDFIRMIEMLFFTMDVKKPYLIRNQETIPPAIQVAMLEANTQTKKKQLLLEGEKSGS